ncbi:MAG: hypothetical protein WBP94_05820 [Rhodomicrobiaceae bacterium]
MFDEARIVVGSAYLTLERLRDPSEIDAIRNILAEANELLAKTQAGAGAPNRDMASTPFSP